MYKSKVYRPALVFLIFSLLLTAITFGMWEIQKKQLSIMNNQLHDAREEQKLALQQLYELNLQTNIRIDKLQNELTDYKEDMKKKLSISRGGSIRGYATAYSPRDNVDGQQAGGPNSPCSTGVPPGPGKFAVDPKRIPYGSSITVTLADGRVFHGIAADTGGALRSSQYYEVDIYCDTYKEACDFGRQPATIEWQVNK